MTSAQAPSSVLARAIGIKPGSPLQPIAFVLLAILPLLLISTRAGSDIAVCLIALLFAVESLWRRQWQWTEAADIRALLALWGWMLASSWLTPVNPAGAFVAALIWGRFLLFYAAARYWLITGPEELRALKIPGLVALGLLAAAGLWQYHLHGGPYDRLTIPFSHNPNVGHYMLKVGLPMLGLWFWRTLDKGRRCRLWQPLAGLLVMVVIIMVSGERSSALLLFLALGLLLLILAYGQPQARRLLAGLAIGVVALLEVLAATQAVIQQRGTFLIQQLSDFWATQYGQLYIGAWRLWQRHPVTGIGVQQFLAACQPAVLHTTYCDVHPHNMYMAWLASTGAPGLALLGLALFFMLRGLLGRAQFTGTPGVLFAFAVAGFTVNVFPLVVTQSPYSNWPAIIYWYCVALSLSLPNALTVKR